MRGSAHYITAKEVGAQPYLTPSLFPGPSKSYFFHHCQTATQQCFALGISSKMTKREGGDEPRTQNASCSMWTLVIKAKTF